MSDRRPISLSLSVWGVRASMVLVGLTMIGCDSVSDDAEVVVVESFLESGQPLPDVRVSRTTAIGASRSSPVVGNALVVMELNGRPFEYTLSEASGRYIPPPGAPIVSPGAEFRLQVLAGSDRVSASGLVPPPVSIDSIRVSIPSAPISAVFLDSLSIPLDSLASGLPSRTGFIYPIDVTMWWHPTGGTTTGYWIETSLDPVEEFSSVLVDFFLLPSAVLEEPLGSREQLSWTGLYAVPVDTEDDPLPEHDLKVSLLRSTLDYARFALSSRDPERREPDGNVAGGIGIVAGISLDTLRVRVR